MEHEGNDDTNCGWCTWDNPQRIGKGTGRLGNKRTSRDHPGNSIIKIGYNTEKNPGDLRRPFTQAHVKNNQLMPVNPPSQMSK